MTGLIDADKLYIIAYGSRRNGKTAFADAFEKMIKEIPTVDAIPVAWIEQYGKANWYDFGTKHNAITEMLEEWERIKRYEAD